MKQVTPQCPTCKSLAFEVDETEYKKRVYSIALGRCDRRSAPTASTYTIICRCVRCGGRWRISADDWARLKARADVPAAPTRRNNRLAALGAIIVRIDGRPELRYYAAPDGSTLYRSSARSLVEIDTGARLHSRSHITARVTGYVAALYGVYAAANAEISFSDGFTWID